ncbi:MAG: DUF748 domain-containing protein [Bacteroidia bacterium]
MGLKEKKTRKGWKKLLIIFSLVVVGFIVVVIIFISPITKYLVEKNDVKYFGREITMDWAYVNPFTGYIHFSNLKIYEHNSDSVFFSASGLSVNFAMSKLLSKTYEISSLALDQPYGIIVQNKKHFNFSDLIEKFTSKEKQDTTKAPVHFNILDLEIKEGEFQFIDEVTPINYSIKKVNFKSTGKYWNVDSINGKFSFIPGTGSGDVSGNFMLNANNMDYHIATVIHKLDLNLIEQYMKDLTNYGSFSANLDADLKAKGNLNNAQDINLNGNLALNDFHFGKTPTDDFASFEKLSVGIKELAPEIKKYFFDSVTLAHPYFKFEQYDYLDNIQRMFGKEGSNVKAVNENPAKFNLIIEIADYVKVVFENFLESDYKINNVDLNNGDIHFNDYSINEKFAAEIEPLSIKADSVYSTKKWVNLFLKSGIKPFGTLDITASMNPKDNKDFNLTYKLEKIPAAAFNPYLVSFTSFPLDRGVLELNGNWNVRNDVIESTNHFVVVDARVTKRIRKKDSKWIPMPLILAFIRERGNVTDYEIPVTGDLSHPDFHLKDVIFDLLKNIFVKPVTTPYRMEVKNIENEIEKSLLLTWAMRQSKLHHTQETFMNKMADFLKANHEANLTVHPYQYAEKEKEYILLFEAKKNYFFSGKNKNEGTMTEDDSTYIEKMSSKDSGFIKYLDAHVKDSMLFTVQEKCYRLVGATLVNKKFEQLIKERERVFMNYFKNSGTEKQVKLSASENTIPFNGFSFFKINYKGDVPKSLMSAYEKLKEMNSEAPRKKYLNYREGKG